MTRAPKPPEPVPFDSTKGLDRRARIERRISYLERSCAGWVAKAEASALRWALALLGELSRRVAELEGRVAELERESGHAFRSEK